MLQRRRTAALATALSLALVAAGCGGGDESSKGSTTTVKTDFPSVDQPGVTDTEINVGGIVSVTNPVGGAYGSAYDGVEAYFKMINEEEGGVYGRKLVEKEKLDDNGVKNAASADQLIAADVFAAVPVHTLLFTGADKLADAKIPTFGWNINAEWAGTDAKPKPTLFGEAGSYQPISDPVPMIPWVASDAKAKKVGVLAYGVAQSQNCAKGIKGSVERWGPTAGVELAYFDDGLSYGEKNLSVQVKKMKSAGVDLVATCMDNNAVITLAEEMNKQGLDAPQVLLNGYDQNLIKQNGDLLEGSYVRASFAAFELAEKDQPEGLKNFLKYMEKIGKDPTENAAVGWVNANQFVDGLKAAGENFTREKVVDAINKMTDWNGDGMVPSIDWTVQHNTVKTVDVVCGTWVKVKDGAFSADYSKSGKPFICFDGREDKIKVTYE